MNFARGLLSGVASGADAYTGILKEESKRKYEDQKSKTMYDRQVSLENLRKQSNLEVGAIKQGYEKENIKARGNQAMAQDANRANLQAEAKVKERKAMKEEMTEEDVLLLNTKIEKGMIDPEVGKTIVELRQAGIPMKDLIPEQGKPLTPQQLEVLSKTAERLNPEDPQAEFVRLQEQFTGSTGGGIGRKVSQNAKEAKAQKVVDMAMSDISEISTKEDAVNYLNKAKQANLPPSVIQAAEARVREIEEDYTRRSQPLVTDRPIQGIGGMAPSKGLLSNSTY